MSDVNGLKAHWEEKAEEEQREQAEREMALEAEDIADKIARQPWPLGWRVGGKVVRKTPQVVSIEPDYQPYRYQDQVGVQGLMQNLMDEPVDDDE